VTDKTQTLEKQTRKAQVKEIAALLRSTDSMAMQFAEHVQDRVGQQVSFADIVKAMKTVPPKSLTMGKVINKVRRQLG
jgi:hypothetical protein